MEKLLKAFQDNPTLENAIKLSRYDFKHPMASVMLSKEKSDILRKATRMFDNANSISMGKPSVNLAKI